MSERGQLLDHGRKRDVSEDARHFLTYHFAIAKKWQLGSCQSQLATRNAVSSVASAARDAARRICAESLPLEPAMKGRQWSNRCSLRVAGERQAGAALEDREEGEMV